MCSSNATGGNAATTPDIEVDYDSVETTLDVIGRCLRVDRKLNPAFNRTLIAWLRELTAAPERGKWQTWIAVVARLEE